MNSQFATPLFRCFAAVSAAVLFASAAQAETVDTINKSFSVSPGGHLVVAVDDGAITVRTGHAPEVAVEVVRKVRANTKENEEQVLRQHEVTIEQDGDTITVRARRKDSFLSWWSSLRLRTDFHFTITVPERFDADLKTSGGGIDVDGLAGSVVANTSGGGMRFSRINGPIDGKTSGGGITLVGCDGDTKVHTSGGGIESRDGEGALDLDTSGGGIVVRGHRGDVVAHTSGGGITTENILGSIQGNTSGGSIRATLAAQPTGDCHLSTSGGGITVQLPAGVALIVDASTSAGSVSSEFPVAGANERKTSRLNGTINGGGHLLHLRSSAGSIHLVKLPAGPEA